MARQASSSSKFCIGFVAKFVVLSSAAAGQAAEGLGSSLGITEREIAAHATYLTSDELQGRQAGHRGAELAAAYIARELDSYGLEPFSETWEFPFHVRGGASEGFGKITFGTTTVMAPNVVNAPSYSPAGVVRAPVVVDPSADVVHKLVAVEPEDDERAQAAALLARGAAGVIFLRSESSLAPATPATLITFSIDMTLEERMAQLDDATRRQVLESVRLDGPVICISSSLHGLIHRYAAKGDELIIEVRRVGRDRSSNVVGVLRGSDPLLRDEYVVIGAHYDHVGIINGELHPGADDNASGVAALLELAESLAAAQYRPRRSILVIGWGAEELKMIGSSAFCRNPPINLENVVALINFDMIGRNDPEAVLLAAASDQLLSLASERAARHGFTRINDGDPKRHLDSTDTAPFYARNIPCLSFHTGLHQDYHTPHDTLDRLDTDKVTRIARWAFDVVNEVANAKARPDSQPLEQPE